MQCTPRRAVQANLSSSHHGMHLHSHARCLLQRCVEEDQSPRCGAKRGGSTTSSPQIGGDNSFGDRSNVQRASFLNFVSTCPPKDGHDTAHSLPGWAACRDSWSTADEAGSDIHRSSCASSNSRNQINPTRQRQGSSIIRGQPLLVTAPSTCTSSAMHNMQIDDICT